MNTDQRPVSSSQVTAEIRSLFAARGDSNYGEEAVTQCQHALQAAWFAEQAGSPPALIVAALLHDVGHLLHDLPDDAPTSGVDDQHELLAARWLRHRFGAEVIDPVVMHVAAKRYLCATDASYTAQLSPPSQLSLQLQGGPMSDEEARSFECQPFFDAAIRLRRWDDAAKQPDLETPDLEHFLQQVAQVASGRPV